MTIYANFKTQAAFGIGRIKFHGKQRVTDGNGFAGSFFAGNFRAVLNDCIQIRRATVDFQFKAGHCGNFNFLPFVLDIYVSVNADVADNVRNFRAGRINVFNPVIGSDSLIKLRFNVVE